MNFLAPHTPKDKIQTSHKGNLLNMKFLCKDMCHIKGFKTSCGNPDFYKHSKEAIENAPFLQKILNEGAILEGITICDEFFYSIIGENIHYGTPINKNAPITGAAGITMTIAKCPPNQGPGLHNHQATFETFTVLKGKFLIAWNDDGSEEIILNELDTISIPPGVCRSFKNISDEEGLLQVIISGGVHDMNDIAFTKVAKDQMEKIETNLSKKFEDVGFKFNAGLNN